MDGQQLFPILSLGEHCRAIEIFAVLHLTDLLTMFDKSLMLAKFVVYDFMAKYHVPADRFVTVYRDTPALLTMICRFKSCGEGPYST